MNYTYAGYPSQPGYAYPQSYGSYPGYVPAGPSGPNANSTTAYGSPAYTSTAQPTVATEQPPQFSGKDKSGSATGGASFAKKGLMGVALAAAAALGISALSGQTSQTEDAEATEKKAPGNFLQQLFSGDFLKGIKQTLSRLFDSVIDLFTTAKKQVEDIPVDSDETVTPEDSESEEEYETAEETPEPSANLGKTIFNFLSNKLFGEKHTA